MSVLHRRRPLARYLLASLVAVLVAAGCGGSSSSGGGGSSGKTYTVAMLHGLSNQFQTDIGKGAADVASKNGITFQQLYFNLNAQREKVSIESGDSQSAA